jgi:predicted Zn-dependent protease
VLQDNPESDLALNNLAMLLTEYRGDAASLNKARDLLGRIRARNNPAYQDTLGWVMYRSGEINTAVETLRDAAAQMSDTPMVQYHLGMALAASGNGVEAKAALSRALEGTQDFRGRKDAERTLKNLK